MREPVLKILNPITGPNQQTCVTQMAHCNVNTISSHENNVLKYLNTAKMLKNA